MLRSLVGSEMCIRDSTQYILDLETPALRQAALTCVKWATLTREDQVLYHRRVNPANCVLWACPDEWGGLVDIGPLSKHIVGRASKSRNRTRNYSIEKFGVTRCDFTILVRFRVSDWSCHQRAPLLSNWVRHWSFLLFCSKNQGPLLELRRNINSGGSDPEQGLVTVQCTSQHGTPIQLPMEWTVCGFTWSRARRTLTSYLNGNKCQESTVRESAAHDVNVQQNREQHVLVGGKGDAPSESWDGAVSHVICMQACLEEEAVATLSACVESNHTMQSWADEAAACLPMSKRLPQRSDEY
eukprot:TRINITY_DN16669_c0_g1_i3.p1 TRINITY_DN16669_c0_g1~~TRINITY_DN16669_c0_g1_i3.p1  ORF type:complete len:346 (+),score=40.62 TRINITY_DN16669_c0_g1_i3:145-1038(+)